MTLPDRVLAFKGDPAVKAACIDLLRIKLATHGSLQHIENELVGSDIPEWLVNAGDECAKGKSARWALVFLDAIRPAADLDIIKAPFLVIVLRGAREKIIPRYVDVLAAVDRAIALWQRLDVASPAWQHEASATEDAAAKAASEADARPPWNAAKTAASAAVAARVPRAVADAVHEACCTASRAGYGFDSDGFAEELLRLVRAQ